ncbi:MAG: ribosome silencing factor [Paludibacteraceae bacterium]|nr:ribosome silencing factor [Paludibacteraceae bacterium]
MNFVETDILVEKIVEGMQEVKAKKIVTLDMSELDTYSCPHFVICEGNSTSQVTAIADSVRRYVREQIQVHPIITDGYQNAQWIAVDYGEVIVHIMLPELREFYAIEELWADGKKVVVPDLD